MKFNLSSFLKFSPLILVLTFFVLLGTGCEDEEASKLFEAQACLDKITTNGADAENCRKHIAGLTSQQAKVIECSIEMMIGGLTTSKITSSFLELSQGSETDQEARLIQALAVNTGNPTADKAQARKSFDACEASGVSGLIYFSSLVRIGTLTLGLAANAAADFQACIDSPDSCDDAEVGETVIVVAESYCDTEANKDTEVCSVINSAVATGSTPEEVAQALYILMNQP